MRLATTRRQPGGVCRGFWPEHWDPVQPGDRILLPKVPGWGRWRLVEVVGSYRFERHPLTGDHGHILPVRTIVPDIASSNSAVSARLQRTMRNQGPMWNVDALSKNIDRLLAAGDTVARGDAPTDRLNNVLNDTLERLLPRLRDDFRSNQLEEPVFRLLTHLFPTAVVEKRAGPHEQGADFLIVETDAFGHEHRTVVQLKDYAEQLSGMTALNQIREASAAYAPVSAAVILTTAQDESRDFARARDDLGEGWRFPSRRYSDHNSPDGFSRIWRPSPPTEGVRPDPRRAFCRAGAWPPFH